MNNLEDAFNVLVVGKSLFKISLALKQQIKSWIEKSEYVRQSPNMNDVLIIDGRQVPKLLLEISIIELHRELARSGIVGILDEKMSL